MRPVAALAAVVVVVLATLLTGVPAAAATGGLRLVLTEMNPRVVTADGPEHAHHQRHAGERRARPGHRSAGTRPARQPAHHGSTAPRRARRRRAHRLRRLPVRGPRRRAGARRPAAGAPLRAAARIRPLARRHRRARAAHQRERHPGGPRPGPPRRRPHAAAGARPARRGARPVARRPGADHRALPDRRAAAPHRHRAGGAAAARQRLPRRLLRHHRTARRRGRRARAARARRVAGAHGALPGDRPRPRRDRLRDEPGLPGRRAGRGRGRGHRRRGGRAVARPAFGRGEGRVRGRAALRRRGPRGPQPRRAHRRRPRARSAQGGRSCRRCCRPPCPPTSRGPPTGVLDNPTLDIVQASGARAVLLSADAVSGRVRGGVVPLAGRPVTALLTDPLLTRAATAPPATPVAPGPGAAATAESLAGDGGPLATQDLLGAVAFRAGGRRARSSWRRRTSGAPTAPGRARCSTPSARSSPRGRSPRPGSPTPRGEPPPATPVRPDPPVDAAEVPARRSARSPTRRAPSRTCAARSSTSNVGITADQLFAPLQFGLLRGASAAYRGSPPAAQDAAAAVLARVDAIRNSIRVLEPPNPYALGSSDAPLPVTVGQRAAGHRAGAGGAHEHVRAAGRRRSTCSRSRRSAAARCR